MTRWGWLGWHRRADERAAERARRLRAAAASLEDAEAARHEESLRAAHEARAEAEQSVAKAVEVRIALHALTQALRAGPQPEDRFARGMEDTFKTRRRENPP